MSRETTASTASSDVRSSPKYSQSPNELISLEVWRQNTGFELIDGIRRGRFAHPPIAEVLDFQLVEVSIGEVVFEGQSRFGFCNPMGTIHGGWYATLLDSAMACAVVSALPRGRLCTTLELKVNFVRSVPINHLVRARGEVVHVGRTTAVAEARLIDADGRLYCTSNTTNLLLDVSAPSD